MPFYYVSPDGSTGVSPSLEKFRGNWTSTPEVEVWASDFNAGNPFNGGTIVPISTPPGDNVPLISKCIYLDNVISQPSIDFTNILPQDRTITKVEYYRTCYIESRQWVDSGAIFVAKLNDVKKWNKSFWSPENDKGSKATEGWVLDSYSTTSPLTSMSFGIESKTSYALARVAIAGIKVYAVDDAFLPYNTGQYVTYDDKLWVSTIDSNSFEPGGIENTWTLVPIIDTDAARQSDLDLLEARVAALENI